MESVTAQKIALLVDGEATARSHRAALLKSCGFNVVEAAGAQEALAKSARQDGGVQLLVTEVILPGGSFGFDLRDALLPRNPDLKIAYTTRFDLSGYEQALEGHQPLPVTATDDEFIKHCQSAPEAGAPLPAKPLLEPGTTLGHYQVLHLLYAETETETYQALQYTVQRPVALVVLKPQFGSNPESLASFKNREQAKAQITHPRIAPLYEAGQVGEWYYYTREQPPGMSLEDFAKSGKTLSERNLTDVLYRVAEAVAFGIERGYDYRPLALRDVFVDAESQASIVNVFRPHASNPRDQKADVQAFLLLLLPLTSPGKARGHLSDLAGQDLDWQGLAAVLSEVRADMSDRSLLQRAEGEDIALPVSPAIRWIAGLTGCALMVAVAFLGGLTGDNLSEQKLIKEDYVAIPATDIPAYRISKYEVTIGQYAEFLQALEKLPAKPFEHKDQPATKTSHKPPQWDESYAAAKTGGLFNGEPISLNHPVTRVDFWDAWAYARWRKARLPTEQEWEYAARGPKNLRYPWGNEPKATDANFGDDRRDVDGGVLDGYNSTAPVDQPATDKSPFGIMGMAGNVQEWTSSMAPHPELPGVIVPVVRGGYFGEKSTASVLTYRYFPNTPSETGLARGFRTADEPVD
ncbi:MAG: SUMF1/EgtB/PvdO family nonheme iron enzyme [Verrucomicrobiaceae bacterium]|nr:SUMF1/EgtB/PvdO family nonheme iron enzyme [Verrucomicrobiaceae bacterium]